MVLEWFLGGALAALALVTGLLIRVARRLRRVDHADHRGSMEQRLAALADTQERTSAALVQLAERTAHLTQVHRDLETLKARTQDLPVHMTTIAGRTERLPEAGQVLGQMHERLTTLHRIERHIGELHGVFQRTTGRGQIGEAAVRRVLSAFPDDVWAEQYALPTGVVDFVVRAPNGTLVPIDSKTGGADDVRAFLDALGALSSMEDADSRAIDAARRRVQTARAKVEARVRHAGRGLPRYIVPQSGTAPFVVQALPDAVCDALGPRTRQDMAATGVLVVPYGLLHPFASALRRTLAHGEVDAARLSAALVKVHESTRSIEETVRNSVERAATLAANAAQRMRGDVDAIRAALLAVEVRVPVKERENGSIPTVR